ncbi:uncharacterized protein LOC121871883 [Homarus americanus]|uniref:Uncharacterized protein n=1 Tax=Homarus americanus TaxID=6706 RepID=A0A8J5JZF8_HOMAM|nr:uncharacterized protein LOC121871883 [Homarus americanus]XP_042230404.1 uncharacterized protein LOC121871883 [Homarus americanus]KAG7164504.1 hypothetical protein Hamer_G003717 [Homarus americanus]
MADECVVCGEAVEGKPLYKKLGSGEFNVEVITALRALELTRLPETAKNDRYICWDCDEAIVGEYGRYLEDENKQKVEKAKQKQVKKQHRTRQKKKQRVQNQKKPIAQPIPVKTTRLKLSKTKQLELKRASNAHHNTHCVMCDNNFESGDRGYQRFPLKKSVSDELDVAQVMEQLGLARHIETKMKGRRFVCNPCFFIIRRTYKNKLMKGTATEGSSSSHGGTATATSQNPIHRATTEEHAAEIAKLLPPALAECYKILTSDCMTKRMSDDANNVDSRLRENDDISEPVTSKKVVPDNIDKEHLVSCESAPDGEQCDDQGFETEAEEEDSGLNVSQDEHGNYFIDMDIMSSPESDDDRVAGVNGDKESGEENMNDASHTPRKKKNVLLPRRLHHHLSVNLSDDKRQPETCSLTQVANIQEAKDDSKTETLTSNQVLTHIGICNICGISFTGKPQDWWHTLTSPLSGFESITVTMALKLLETSLAHTSKEARDARQVCLSCYGMVSVGFRSQVVQKIARQKNINASQVNFSKVKVRMVPKEDLKSVLGNHPEERGKALVENCETHNKETGEYEKENLVISEIKGIKRKCSDEVEVIRKEKRLKYGKQRISKALSTKNAGEDNNYKRKIRSREVISCNMREEKNDQTVDFSTKSGRKIKLNQKYIERKEDYNNTDQNFFGTEEDIDNEILTRRKKKISSNITQNAHCQNAVYSTKSGRKIKFTQKYVEADEEYKDTNQDFFDTVDDHNHSPISKQEFLQVTSQNCVTSQDKGQSYLREDTNVWSDSGGDSFEVNNSNKQSLSTQKINSRTPRNDDNESKKPNAVVVLKDLKFVLPQEAFGGKTVSAVKIEGNICQQTSSSDPSSHPKQLVTPGWSTQSCHSSPNQGAYSSPLQFIFNSMSTLQPEGASLSSSMHNQAPEVQFAGGSNLVNKDIDPSSVYVDGRCVVCGCNYNVQRNFWHSIEDHIKPPILMVPVRWVCLSLSVAALQLSQEDHDEGKVCRHCYVRLAKQFEIFVKMKVGESCGLSPKAVDLSEYLITFNQATMNIEADPNQCFSSQECEDAGQLLQKILPVIQSFSIDDIVARCHRQPLDMEDYSVWLLLVLNDLRIQTGASIGDLAAWLIRLMPSKMYDEGLRPCLSNLASFLLSVTKSSDIFTEDRLSAAIPPEVFILDNHSHGTTLSTTNTPTEMNTLNIKSSNFHQNHRGDQLNCVEREWDDGDKLSWEDFLTYVNLDDLMKGTAKPLSMKQFSNGVLYALWRVSRMLGENIRIVGDWLRQLSPIPLQKEQLDNLVTSCAGPLHSHLEKYPQDMHKLKCELISHLESSNSLNTPERQRIGRKKYCMSGSPVRSKIKVENGSKYLSVQENKTDGLGMCGSNIIGNIKRKRGRPRKRPLTLSESGISEQNNSNKNYHHKHALTSPGGVPMHGDSEEICSHKTAATSAESSSNLCGTSVENVSCKTSEAIDSSPSMLQKKKNSLVHQKEKVKLENTRTPVLNRKNAKSTQNKTIEGNIINVDSFEEKLHNGVREVSRSKRNTRSVGSIESECEETTTTRKDEQLLTQVKQDINLEDLDRPSVDDAKESESLQISSMLVNKMKDLEKQLQEMKKRNNELMEDNRKLVRVCFEGKKDEILVDQQHPASIDSKSVEDFSNETSQSKTSSIPDNPPVGVTQSSSEVIVHTTPNDHSFKKLSYKKGESSIKDSDHKNDEKFLEKQKITRRQQGKLHKMIKDTKSPQMDLENNPLTMGTSLRVRKNHSKENENDAAASHIPVMPTDKLPDSSLKRKSLSRYARSKHLDAEDKGSTLKNFVRKKGKNRQPKKVSKKSSLPFSKTSDDITQVSTKTQAKRLRFSQELEKSQADLKSGSEETSIPSKGDKSEICEKRHGSRKKKPKPRFEDLMNYDAGATIPP